MKSVVKARFFFLFIFTFGLCHPFSAQVVTLTGTVTDEIGAVIPGARVICRNVQGKTFEASTDDAGWYGVNLSRGSFNIVISQYPFQDFVRNNFVVPESDLVKLDVVLRCANRCGERIEDFPTIDPLETGESTIPDHIYTRPLPLRPLTNLKYIKNKKH